MFSIFLKCYLALELECSYIVVDAVECVLEDRMSVFLATQQRIENCLQASSYTTKIKIDGPRSTRRKWKKPASNTRFLITGSYVVLVRRKKSSVSAYRYVWDNYWNLVRHPNGNFVVHDLGQNPREISIPEFLEIIRDVAIDENK